MNYRIGLDIGIGSVGWAVVSAQDEGHPARIEDFGTRIFQSGEDEKTSESLCKGRRGFRGVRRIERRRINRRLMLKYHFINIGLAGDRFDDELADVKDKDVYLLKTKALDLQISPAELYKCLVHTCNHRGFKEFYEPSDEDDEDGINAVAANAFEKEFKESGKRTVSEFLCEKYRKNGFVYFRNRKGSENMHKLIRRDLLEKEVEMILSSQQKYYPCLTDLNVKRTVDIIFAQRDFEDGPGDPNDPGRRYRGFLENLGTCQYYKDCKRGFRGTVISDVYAVVNTLSQYRFVNKTTGEYELPREIACEIIDFLLKNGNIGINDVKAILKAHGYSLYKSANSDSEGLSKAVKFLFLAKKSVESAGMSWEEIISEDQFDIDHPSLLHKIGGLLSTYQTPSRRRKELEKSGIEPRLVKAFADKKIGGTSSVSYEYMIDSIKAFENGEIYGNFQANKVKEHQLESDEKRTVKLAPSVISDPEIRDNRVVFKAVNETRKIVNAIIDTYGSPESIIVEVASELGNSIETRRKMTADNRAKEKENSKIIEEIAELLSIEKPSVSGSMIERYRLFKQQEGKCAYSGEELGELKAVVANLDHVYEIDHIIPYSLILDNTLNNKFLVFANENQKKGQQTPLMYLNGDDAKNAFRAFVNHLSTRKVDPISKKKQEYCNLKSLYGPEAEQILGEWKSRNINDTRYITKYVAGLLDKNLVFAGGDKQHVFTVKGAVTQKFRREWFRDTKWGEEEKNRDNYLNHAIDALIAANLTKAYIEIGSDALRLKAIRKKYHNNVTKEFEDYLDSCIAKMKKYYGFGEKETEKLLLSEKRAPAYVPRLLEEVEARTFEGSKEEFDKKIASVYKNDPEFVVAPHMPVTSLKQNKKYSGEIADENYLKLREINGEIHKIKRVDIRELTAKSLEQLYTEDEGFRASLEKIFAGKGEKYTLSDYLKENGLDFFRDKNGRVIRRASLDDGVVSNYYRIDKSEDNHGVLGGLKYYCVELYRNEKGELKTCGVRYVDIVKKDKKLYRKEESLPADYVSHEMYLFQGDYVRLTDRKGEVKIEGYYKSVNNINLSSFCFKEPNCNDKMFKYISSKDTVVKIYVDILGRVGGEIKCSAPLPCIRAKK